MRVLVAAVALLMASVVLSGCTANEPTSEVEGSSTSSSGSASASTTQTGSSSGTTTSSSNQTTNQTTNRAPTANITANRTSGTAPLNVSFTLSGSDPDGNNLTWSVSFGGNATTNGTKLPSNVSHVFQSAGNHTVRLTISDGKANATSNVTVRVDAAAAPAAPAPPADPWAFCNRPDAEAIGPLWLDVRELPPNYSIWVYQESNGKAGLQVGGAGEEGVYVPCPNPDTLIF